MTTENVFKFLLYLIGNLDEDRISQNFEAIALLSSSFEKYNAILIPDSLCGFPSFHFWKLLRSSFGP